jgi:DNA gyrase inhibitor GyrI
VMPSGYTGSTLPRSLDASVQIKTWPGGNYAAIRFGGFPNDQKIRKAIGVLKAELTASGISFKDEPMYLGYNPPYQIIFRRNEVIIPVEWKKTE